MAELIEKEGAEEVLARSIVKNKWQPLQTESVSKKNEFGEAFLHHYLGLSPPTVARFLHGGGDLSLVLATEEVVGRALNGKRGPHRDLKKFWEEVERIFPGLHTEEEQALIDKYEGAIDWMRIWITKSYFEQSPVLDRIASIAHAYK